MKKQTKQSQVCLATEHAAIVVFRGSQTELDCKVLSGMNLRNNISFQKFIFVCVYNLKITLSYLICFHVLAFR